MSIEDGTIDGGDVAEIESDVQVIVRTSHAIANAYVAEIDLGPRIAFGWVLASSLWVGYSYVKALSAIRIGTWRHLKIDENNPQFSNMRVYYQNYQERLAKNLLTISNILTKNQFAHLKDYLPLPEQRIPSFIGPFVDTADDKVIETSRIIDAIWRYRSAFYTNDWLFSLKEFGQFRAKYVTLRFLADLRGIRTPETLVAAPDFESLISNSQPATEFFDQFVDLYMTMNDRLPHRLRLLFTQEQIDRLPSNCRW